MGSTESLIETARKWRECNQEYQGGVVLIWQGEAYGWKNCLRDPAHEQPGAFAVDLDGHIFIAEGGTGYDGAKCWVAFSPKSSEFLTKENNMDPIDKYEAREREKGAAILQSSSRGKSAFALASMALEHCGSGAETAARLLLSMEYGHPFNVQNLYRFDTENRAHAEVAIAGCVAHELWPSGWMDAEGFDGAGIMQQLRDKWKNEE